MFVLSYLGQSRVDKGNFGNSLLRKAMLHLLRLKKNMYTLAGNVVFLERLQGIMHAEYFPGDYECFEPHVSWLPAAGIFQKSHAEWAELLVQTSEQRVQETVCVTPNLVGKF
jgi:hypothetical protein